MMTGEHLSAEQLRDILHVSAIVNSSLEPREVRRLAVEAATRLVDAERASLLLVDQRAHRLYFEVALGEESGSLGHIRIAPGQGIAGSVLQSCSAQIVNDVRSDPRFDSGLDSRTGFTTRSLIAAPLTCKGEPLGVLEVINKRSGDFDDTDLAVVTLLANEIAIAVENARLYARLRRSFIEIAAYAAIFCALFVGAGLWILSLTG